MSQVARRYGSSWSRYLLWVFSAALAAMVVTAALFHEAWLPQTRQVLGFPGRAAQPSAAAESHAESEGHSHAHGGHDEANSIELSEQGRKNIGLTLAKVELKTFIESVSIPGVIEEMPGRSNIDVTAPMTGVVTRIYFEQGAAVAPGDRLFDIRLTDEDLVRLQADLLRTAEELRVLEREIKRLADITADGAIARKTLLERQYEQQKQQAVLGSQKQSLLLHGLSTKDVDRILTDRRLVSEVSVFAPAESENGEAVFQVQELRVTRGQSVMVGATLAVLADHGQLYVAGNAFEQDLPAISRAADQGWPVSLIIESESEAERVVSNLSVLYVAARIDPETRTVHFYVRLPNEKTRDIKSETGQRFIAWRYKPGQRVQIQIPVNEYADRIVLPLGAVAQDGAENYVFTPNGDHFDRKPVHVEFRDTQSAVIANDGTLFPGSWVAVSGAQQLQIALKNKSGGAPDPHAGHNH
jgi:membrane fusion protein, heavy metal efflux system